MDSTSAADLAEDSKEASTENMEVEITEADLEQNGVVATSRPKTSSDTSKKRGEQVRQAMKKYRMKMSFFTNVLQMLHHHRSFVDQSGG